MPLARSILPIASLLVGMCLLLAAGGLHSILIPIRGALEGFSTYAIGIIGAGYALGFTAGCVLVPHVVRRVGHVRTFSALVSALGANVLLCGIFPNAWFWILLRVLAGFSFAGCYMIAESWLNERVSNAQRGTIFSFYAIATQGGLMAGQYALVVAPPERDTLFMLGAILYALAVLPTAVSKAQSPAPLTTTRLDVMGLFHRSPVAFFGAIMSGVISSSWSNFAPVYGQQVGLSNAAIATLIALAMLGSVSLQLPIGRLSDRIDRRYAMAIVGAAGAVLGTILTWSTNVGAFGPAFYGALFCYGAAIYSIYAIVVAHGNDWAEDGAFVETASALLILYGVGTMVGPLFAAQLMTSFGPTGVFTATTVAHVALAAFAVYRTFRRPDLARTEQTDFSRLPIGRAQTPETFALDPRSEDEDDGPATAADLPTISVATGEITPAGAASPTRT